ACDRSPNTTTSSGCSEFSRRSGRRRRCRLDGCGHGWTARLMLPELTFAFRDEGVDRAVVVSPRHRELELELGGRPGALHEPGDPLTVRDLHRRPRVLVVVLVAEEFGEGPLARLLLALEDHTLIGDRRDAGVDYGRLFFTGLVRSACSANVVAHTFGDTERE